MNYKELMPKLQGAIFDFDGTLFDSMYLWDNVARDSLIAIGIAPPDGYRDILRNLSIAEAAEYTVERFNLSMTPADFVKVIHDCVSHYYYDEVLPKPGIPELLKDMHDNGVKICVATASEKFQIEAALKRCGLEHLFEEILTCTIVGESKQSPKIFETALEHLGTTKENTLIFEDSLYALKTAKSAGFKTVGIFDKSEKNQQELKSLADFYIENFI